MTRAAAPKILLISLAIAAMLFMAAFPEYLR
jgi:hypothetical protein